MDWLICGTVPDVTKGLISGEAQVQLSAGRALRKDADAPLASGSSSENLVLIKHDGGDLPLPLERGSTALVAAFALTARELGTAPPRVLLAGDCGDGAGSRNLYKHLYKNAASCAGQGITFHYLQPDVDWHNMIYLALEALQPRPVLCADAGFMYAAKMSGYAAFYDLFTPDAGELAFLADELAPHPFYTRGFLLADGQSADEQISRAFESENAAQTLLVKGKVDLIAQAGKVLERVDYPMIPNLEPIGGTGDTVAGIVSAMLAAGYPMLRSCRLAALANRFMGQLAQPTPATQVAELLAQLPGAIRLALQEA